MTSLLRTSCSSTESKGWPLIREAKQTDFRGIKAFLEESSNLYPDITDWWQSKVIPGTRDGSRVVVIVDHGGCVEGVFIGKRGRQAKLCTLRLREPIRGQGIGRALAAQGLDLLTEPQTENVHVTVSEASESRTCCFFRDIGFNETAVARNRYIPGVDEFVYSASGRQLAMFAEDALAEHTIRTLFGTYARVRAPSPMPGTLLFSLRPEFADLFLSGKKQVEFRRAFSKKHLGSKAVIYAGKPDQHFLFTAVISQVVEASVKELWRDVGIQGGIAKNTFQTYFTGKDKGYSIRFDDIQLFQSPVPLDDAKRRSPGFRPPQSFMTIDRYPALLDLLGLAEEGASE